MGERAGTWPYDVTAPSTRRPAVPSLRGVEPMSITPVTHVARGASAPTPRVRHLAREAAALMVFSAATSATLAGCLLLLSSLGR